MITDGGTILEGGGSNVYSGGGGECSVLFLEVEWTNPKCHTSHLCYLYQKKTKYLNVEPSDLTKHAHFSKVSLEITVSKFLTCTLAI